MSEHLLYTAAARFEAALSVGSLPVGHRSRGLHGHSFVTKLRAGAPATAFPGDALRVLKNALEASVAPLDYAHLNPLLATPTDENIARWIRARLALATVDQVGIQSTPRSGVDLDHRDHAHLWRRYAFQAAHRLPNVAPGHKCGRMHGHGFEVILHASQNLAAREMGVDYDHIDRLWAPLFDLLDHACLNDIEGLENPTSELISSWIWQRLKPVFPELAWVTVYETATCGAHFDGARYRIWKDFSLDSAVRLACAPQGDVRRRVHGHTYLLRLHLEAALDTVLGWTMDFGDVKTRFNPVFDRLDHQPLHELPGLEDGDAASILHWIRKASAAQVPGLTRIDLFETPGCGAILSWGEEPPALPI